MYVIDDTGRRHHIVGYWLAERTVVHLLSAAFRIECRFKSLEQSLAFLAVLDAATAKPQLPLQLPPDHRAWRAN